MCATGGSAEMCINLLIKQGVDQSKIIFVNLISCPIGLELLTKKFPNIQIVTAAVDPELN